LTEIAYRPRSAAEIVDAAFQIFRQHFKTFVLVTAIAYLPLLLLDTALSHAFGFDDALAAGSVDSSFLIVSALGMVWLGLVNAVVCAAGSEAYLQRIPDPAAAFRMTLSRAGAVLACVVLVNIAAAIGLVLLIVPGLYLYARYGLAPVVAVLEGGGVQASLARASVLSNGRKRHILFAMFIILLIFFAISLALGFAAQTLLQHPVLVAAAGFVITIVSYPVVALAQTILYYDLRIRAEGYDVQLMSDRLASQAVPASGIEV